MPVHTASFFIVRAPASVPDARKQVARLLARWRVRLDDNTRLAFDVVTTELVTNAVQHTEGALLTIGVYVNPALAKALVEVYDGCATLPQPRIAAPDEEAGRGLLLVEQLAVHYGAQRTKRGKRIWAELALPEQPLSRRQLVMRPSRAAKAVLRRLARPPRSPIPLRGR
ncbi:ATP-binding protein [Kitasatospora sp. NPDC017646]|uniref:ATP-binding protein n=1 Tax=Kitasatospora sp. NPDC017646 TaxID=3364024 RepID=UPI0037B022FE